MFPTSAVRDDRTAVPGASVTRTASPAGKLSTTCDKAVRRRGTPQPGARGPAHGAPLTGPRSRPYRGGQYGGGCQPTARPSTHTAGAAAASGSATPAVKCTNREG